MSKIASLILLAFIGSVRGDARVLLTQEQALATAFPKGKPVRQAFFLTAAQHEAAQKESAAPIADRLIVRYSGPGGFAYFDRHRVRTLPETVMVVVTPEGAIDRVEILSFDEPVDYYPRRRWLDQLLRRKLDAELSLNRGVRPISGASLTGRAIVDATRRVLALHHVLGPGAPSR